MGSLVANCVYKAFTSVWRENKHGALQRERAGRNGARLSTLSGWWEQIILFLSLLHFNIFLIFYTKHSFYCTKLLCMKLCVETSVVSLVAEGRGRAEEPHPPSGFLSSTSPLEVARVNSKAIHYAPREIPYSLYFTINSFIEGTVT